MTFKRSQSGSRFAILKPLRHSLKPVENHSLHRKRELEYFLQYVTVDAGDGKLLTQKLKAAISESERFLLSSSTTFWQAPISPNDGDVFCFISPW